MAKLPSVDIYTVEVGGCGCSVDLHKTCACPKAAQVDVVQCPLHCAAPDLLAAVEKILAKWGNLVPDDRALLRQVVANSKETPHEAP